MRSSAASDVFKRVVCGKCHHAMFGSSTRGYRCNATHGGCGNLRMKAAWLEDPIVSLVLAREAAHVPVTRHIEPSVDIGAIDSEIEAVRRAYAEGDLALEDMTPILKGLRAKRRVGEQEAGRAVVPSWGPLMTHAMWANSDLSQRRALLGKHLSSVVVAPRKETGPGQYDPTRLTIRWKDGTTQQVTTEDLASIPMRDSLRRLWSYPAGTAKVWMGPMVLA
jgi:hypothetical protein